MDWILVGHHEASGLTLIIHNGNMGLPVQGPKTKIREIVTYFELSLKYNKMMDFHLYLRESESTFTMVEENFELYCS